MANVKIDGEAFIDGRYDRLARECGLADADHARGKMAKLWLQCTIERRYVLPIDDVEKVLGENAIGALIAARLGEQVDDGVRIRGTKGRIEWLEKLRKNGKKGGRPKKTKWKPSGFAEQNPLTPALAPSPAPASSFSDTHNTRGRGEPGWSERKTLVMRAIAPYHAERFNLVRSELKSPVRPMQLVGDPAERALADLLEGIPDLSTAEADCLHAVAVREAEARAKRTLQFFGAVMWKPEQFSRAKSMTVDEARQVKANPAQPAVGRANPLKPEQYGPPGDEEI